MANEQQELRSINWNEVFAFTHIFKSFRMAIQPTKMLLALVAIVSMYIGGWVLDRCWQVGGRRAMRSEVSLYVTSSTADFKAAKNGWRSNRPTLAAGLLAEATNEAHFLAVYSAKLPAGRLATAFAEKLAADNSEGTANKPFETKSTDSFLPDANKNWRQVLGAAGDKFCLQVERVNKLMTQADHDVAYSLKSLPTTEERQKETEQLAKDEAKAAQALTARKKEFADQVLTIRGRGIFASLLDYEDHCVDNALAAVWRLDLSTGLASYGKTGNPAELSSAGLLYWVLMAVGGLGWLIAEHGIYAILFLLLCLASWALFGGAVYRIAALHATREEKISAVQALRFSINKFFSFLTAPIIPLLIILVLGLLLAIGGLVGNLGGFGAMLLGLLFFLAILVGLLVAFLLIGLTAGCSLMYPTIAVEGSDSFDAISRSFSYVFARPWRSILYAAVATLHGALCYLFVRLFAFLALAATHTFLNWGIWTGGKKLADGATRLDVLWLAPTFEELHSWTWVAMSWAEKIGAVLIGLWVYLVIGGVAAFLLSYLASSTTVIYTLLRQRVDATELDDVYVEEGSAEVAAEPAAPPAAESGSPPA